MNHKKQLIMLKSISIIGNTLSKKEQRVINGGAIPPCPKGTKYVCVVMNSNRWCYCESTLYIEKKK